MFTYKEAALAHYHTELSYLLHYEPPHVTFFQLIIIELYCIVTFFQLIIIELYCIKINTFKVIRPTQHRIGQFADVVPSQSLGLVLKKLNPTQQKQAKQE